MYQSVMGTIIYVPLIFSKSIVNNYSLLWYWCCLDHFFFISLWFRRRIVKLLGFNFGLGVVSMIETWCRCCIGVVSTGFYPISSSLGSNSFSLTTWWVWFICTRVLCLIYSHSKQARNVNGGWVKKVIAWRRWNSKSRSICSNCW